MRLALLAGPLFALIASTSALAAELTTPTGPVILEVTGLISHTNAGAAAQFDMASLEALGAHATTTKTPWYDGAKTFEGPLGSALLDIVGASGTTLKVTALNDYVTEIPVADFRDHAVILATKLDGAPMSVRDKGPIFVIYPFDQEPALNNETYFGRSAWQVKSIEVY